MTLPRRARPPVYTVRDVKRTLAEEDEDRETDLDAALRRDGDGDRETDVEGPLRRERGGDREADFGGPLRRERGGDGEADFDGPSGPERGGDREADLEGPAPRRRRRVVAVILPVATACVIALALMMLRPAGGERRPQIGSSEGGPSLA